MKIKNVYLTVILCFMSLSAWTQTDNLNIVKNHYPEIFSSIQESSRLQWDDVQVRQAVMEGQAKAFLAIAESQDPMDEGVLAEAILNNSLPDMRTHNTRILNDMSIDNPFPLLKCDWFKVKAYYDRRVTSQYTAATRERTVTPPARTTQTLPREEYDARTTETTPPAYTRTQPEQTQRQDQTKTYTYIPPAPDTRKSESYGRESYFDEYEYDRRSPSYSRTKEKGDSPFHLGIKLGGGLSSMYNMGSYLNRDAKDPYTKYLYNNLQVKSRLGLAAEGGLALMYKSGGFFVQNETGVQYSQANFTNKIYTSASELKEEKYDNSYLYLQTAFHFGGYYEIDKGVHLIAGVGPYVGFRLSSTYSDYGIFNPSLIGKPGDTKDADGNVMSYEEYMKNGEKSIMFGVSGVFGVDINKFRIALYPSMGLTKMHETEEYKPFGLNLGFTYWFF